MQILSSNMSEILKKYKIFSLPHWVLCGFFMLLTLGAILVWNLYPEWIINVDYSFAFMIPVFSVYVLWDRSNKIFKYFEATPDSESYGKLNTLFGVGAFFSFVFGLMIFLLACFLKYYFVGGLTANMMMSYTFAFIAFTFAFLISVENSRGERKSLKERLVFLSLFIFPCFIWLLSAPLNSTLEIYVSLALLSKVTVIVYEIMDFFGAIVEVKGNVITFAKGSVGVADACSGIRSLTACLFAGSFLSAIMLNKFWKKIALVALAMVLAFITNAIRALFLAIWAYNYGSDSIAGSVHDIAGYAVLGMTVVCLLILIPLFEISPVPKAIRLEEERLKREFAASQKNQNSE